MDFLANHPSPHCINAISFEVPWLTLPCIQHSHCNLAWQHWEKQCIRTCDSLRLASDSGTRTSLPCAMKYDIASRGQVTSLNRMYLVMCGGSKAINSTKLLLMESFTWIWIGLKKLVESIWSFKYFKYLSPCPKWFAWDRELLDTWMRKLVIGVALIKQTTTVILGV